jgi:hypothetical protein
MEPRELKHLRPATRKWILEIEDTSALDSHHSKLLLILGQCWDRALEAREQLKEHGTEYTDPRGIRRASPAVKLEQTNMALFNRTLRDLDLDISTPPSERRLPSLRHNRPVSQLRENGHAASP